MLPLALALSTSCDTLLKPDPAEARAWHTAQWQALTAAWHAGQDSFVPPKEPRRPWGLGQEVVSGYAAVLACRKAEADAWQELQEDSRLQLRYCIDLLAALYTREAEPLAELSTELDSRLTQLRSKLDHYSAACRAREQAIESLRSAWKECLPELDLEFELETPYTAEPDNARIEQLRAYHKWAYDRLSRRYLGWSRPSAGMADASATSADADHGEAGQEDSGAAHGTTTAVQIPVAAPEPPAGSEELRAALQALEGALIARHGLETQAASDAQFLARYGGSGSGSQKQSPAGLSDFVLPEQRSATLRYRERRIPIVKARLALLSRVDALLTPAQDVMQTAATRAWQAAWPGCDVETDIYAYAGLQPRK